MMTVLTEKVVLITGALSDIGRATAQAFAKVGYSVVLNHRSKADEAAQFANELVHDFGAPQAIGVQADIRIRSEVMGMFEQIYVRMGRLDVLVNNAGINRDNAFLEMTEEEWETVTNTVLKGTFMCSQEFARCYTGTDGSIINFGATTAITGRKNGANYCPARAGVLTLTKCLALELAPRIRVNTITPGRIDTEEVRLRYHTDDPEIRKDFERDVPLKRMGEAADVASMIIYLVESGKYITGQNMIVDGGLMMR
ncbi:MAG: short-chain dehydrogenase [Chloroflexi bacterium HGW-Chloroflexi-4]|jgi:acetoacetyl-CoA reductase/3-oxoacyl-[acyl-carrier protein] reductase|nr:MAG: short-chain dehydrogenase [Chloroflexi bacterium HGW-Chloroflexi-4]